MIKIDRRAVLFLKPAFGMTCLGIALALQMSGCQRTETLPLSGHLSLEYVGMMDGDLSFKLTNGLSRPIALRVTFGHRKETRPNPGDYSASCTLDEPYIAGAIGPVFVDPPPEPKTIEIRPGSHLQFFLEKDYFLDSAGRRCTLELNLVGGEKIESQEFKL